MTAPVDVVAALIAKRDDAVTRALDNLARYKFDRFGYYCARFVTLNQLLPDTLQAPNPFRRLVHEARRIVGRPDVPLHPAQQLLQAAREALGPLYVAHDQGAFRDCAAPLVGSKAAAKLDRAICDFERYEGSLRGEHRS